MATKKKPKKKVARKRKKAVPLPMSCTHCAAPICISCGLHSKKVIKGAGFCSKECAATLPERRRTTGMRGGVVEEIQYL